MQCTSPILLLKQGIRVPCMHCVSCRISYSREWAVRLMNEFETSHNKGCFITLTYDDEHLPKDNGLHKDDLQKFFKRLRKRLGEHKIKYYACGEYGDKEQIYMSPGAKKPHGRPHYHAIIFNLSVMDCSILLPDTWTFGFFKIMPVFYESCKYVTGYVMKKYNGEMAEENYGIAQTPFRLSSLGLGKSYALEHREKIISDLGVQQGGKNKGFPKYYQSLFEKQDIGDYLKDMTDFEQYKLKQSYNKNCPWKKAIKTRAIDRDTEEKEAYNEWLNVTNPDEVCNWPLERYCNSNFVAWQRNVAKLRDLTVKAKASLYEQKKRGKSL